MTITLAREDEICPPAHLGLLDAHANEALLDQASRDRNAGTSGCDPLRGRGAGHPAPKAGRPVVHLHRRVGAGVEGETERRSAWRELDVVDVLVAVVRVAG